jgi:hypothetical protein
MTELVKKELSKNEEIFVRTIMNIDPTNKKHLIKAYETSGFKATGEDAYLRAVELLKQERVATHLKQLKGDFYDIVKPEKLNILQWLLQLKDDINTPPSTKLNAIKAIQDLGGIYTQKEENTGPKVIINFNGIEKPNNHMKIDDNVIDIDIK